MPPGLVDRGILASTSRTGDCYDNAGAESFFATLKAEHVHHQHFATRTIGAASITGYIERFDHATRSIRTSDTAAPSSSN